MEHPLEQIEEMLDLMATTQYLAQLLRLVGAVAVDTMPPGRPPQEETVDRVVVAGH